MAYVKNGELYYTNWEWIKMWIRRIYIFLFPTINWGTYGDGHGKWYFWISRDWFHRSSFHTVFEIKNPYAHIQKPIKDKNGVMRCPDCGQKFNKKDLEKFENIEKIKNLNHP